MPSASRQMLRSAPRAMRRRTFSLGGQHQCRRESPRVRVLPACPSRSAESFFHPRAKDCNMDGAPFSEYAWAPAAWGLNL